MLPLRIILRGAMALILVFLIGFLSSCRTTRVPEVVSSKNRDSTTVIIREIPVKIPGATVYKSINVDSLRKLFGNGKIERYYETVEVKGLTELRQKIDLLTGQSEADCRTRDSIITVKERTEKQLRERITVLEKKPKEKSAIGKFFQAIKNYFVVIVATVGALFVLFIFYKLFLKR